MNVCQLHNKYMKQVLQISSHWDWLRIAPRRSSCVLVLIGLAKSSLDKRSEEEKRNGESEKGRKRQINKFVVIPKYWQFFEDI